MALVEIFGAKKLTASFDEVLQLFGIDSTDYRKFVKSPEECYRVNVDEKSHVEVKLRENGDEQVIELKLVKDKPDGTAVDYPCVLDEISVTGKLDDSNVVINAVSKTISGEKTSVSPKDFTDLQNAINSFVEKLGAVTNQVYCEGFECCSQDC